MARPCAVLSGNGGTDCESRWRRRSSRARGPAGSGFHRPRRSGTARSAPWHSCKSRPAAPSSDQGAPWEACRIEPAAPTISSGAVSPIARERPRIVPVRMPGKRRREHVIADHLPASRAQRQRGLAERLGHGPKRLLGGDHDDRQDQQAEGQGAGEQRRAQGQALDPEGPDEQGQAENAVNDRRHAGQVGDVGLNDPPQPARRRIFLEVDSRARLPTGIPINATRPSSQRLPTIPTRKPAMRGIARLRFDGQPVLRRFQSSPRLAPIAYQGWSGLPLQAPRKESSRAEARARPRP